MEIHQEKKRKLTEISEESNTCPPTMIMFDPIMDAYSNGDLETMDALIRMSCCENVIFQVPTLQIESIGVDSVVAFWILLHEIYPDAMMNTLDRRIGTLTTVPKSSPVTTPTNASAKTTAITLPNAVSTPTTTMKQRIEYVYKFKATRITNRSIKDTFQEVVDAGIRGKQLTHEDMNRLVVRSISSLSPNYAEEVECVFIVENIFGIDENHQIMHWSYDILASNIR